MKAVLATCANGGVEGGCDGEADFTILRLADAVAAGVDKEHAVLVPVIDKPPLTLVMSRNVLPRIRLGGVLVAMRKAVIARSERLAALAARYVVEFCHG